MYDFKFKLTIDGMVKELIVFEATMNGSFPVYINNEYAGSVFFERSKKAWSTLCENLKEFASDIGEKIKYSDLYFKPVY